MGDWVALVVEWGALAVFSFVRLVLTANRIDTLPGVAPPTAKKKVYSKQLSEPVNS